MNSCHDCDTGWVTSRRRTVCVGEGDGSPGKALKVRAVNVGVIIENRDVVVQVIDRDKEYVRFGVLTKDR